MEDLREKLAALAHDQWAEWVGEVFSEAVQVGDGCLEIQGGDVDRWERQICLRYVDMEDDCGQVESGAKARAEGLAGRILALLKGGDS